MVKTEPAWRKTCLVLFVVQRKNMGTNTHPTLTSVNRSSKVSHPSFKVVPAPPPRCWPMGPSGVSCLVVSASAADPRQLLLQRRREASTLSGPPEHGMFTAEVSSFCRSSTGAVPGPVCDVPLQKRMAWYHCHTRTLGRAQMAISSM